MYRKNISSVLIPMTCYHDHKSISPESDRIIKAVISYDIYT